jgi:N-methylhydantoinase A
MSTRIGIDTGGTFTDFVLFDDSAGTFRVAKIPSTPDDPSRAIHAGLATLTGAEHAGQVVVGTTVATNAVIERRGPEVVFVTNAGFEDVPFIGRLDKERLYDLHWRKPKPLVRRRDCVGVRGRVDHHGVVIEPIAEDDLAALLERFDAYGDPPVVAVSYLFAYLNPEHELRTAAALKERAPQATVSVSHEVSPVWREFERASTTIADAFVKPVIERYVDGVGDVVAADTQLERWNLLGSNGGHLRADQARRRPAQLLLSGLAGGVIGARFFATAAGYPSVFSLDMGGTSCDFGLVLDGAEQYAAEFELAWGTPVSIPCVAVSTIGAGGGSIAWADQGGLLHVGPRSAGAQPGPVAYGLGGSEPTLTDANLTLGRLDPDYFLGGTMPLDLEAARDAFAALGNELGLATEAAAEAAVRIADENMANTIRLIAVERGLDPRDFALIAFGGAGPLHARAVAERLDIPTVLIPPHPGLCSALGAAIAQPRVDRVQTMFTRSDSVDLAAVAAAERSLREATVAELRRNVEVLEPIVRRFADLRYAGQNYELEVVLPDGELDAGWSQLLERFAAEHERQYGFSLPGEPVELINLRMTALRADLPVPLVADPHEDSPAGRREVWFDTNEPANCPIHRRAALRTGDVLAGPLVIEEPDSTTLVFPDDTLQVHESGVLVLTVGGAR